jgi:ferredoxin-thioredoxin reductase catalytic subunit/rhodanese-related sulfurtransferase
MSNENKIDINSEIFQNELNKTWDFINKVNKQFGFVQNPQEEVNEGVAMGLARNKLIYGKRYCPCFIVKGKTQEERKKENNRICPCKPALEQEIPNEGVCHCGLFCTPEYAQKKKMELSLEESIHNNSCNISKEEAKLLLQKEQLDAKELEALLNARDAGLISFKLIDVREPMEYEMAHIKGTDELLPTTKFYDWIENLINEKEHIILYCHTGSRSYQVQNILQAQGKKNVSNFTYGIITYEGEIIKGY